MGQREGVHQSPINHALQTPRRGPGGVHCESVPCSSASWKNSGRTDDGTRSGVATMPAESSASCAAPGQVVASTRRIAAASARRSPSSSWPSTPPVPQPSPCGTAAPRPCSPPDALRAAAFVGRGVLGQRQRRVLLRLHPRGARLRAFLEPAAPGPRFGKGSLVLALAVVAPVPGGPQPVLEAGASCLRYPFNPKNPAPPKATARS